ASAAGVWRRHDAVAAEAADALSSRAGNGQGPTAFVVQGGASTVSRRRFLAASFFSLVIAAVLAVIVYTEHVNASQTVGVWMLVHNVSGGAPYASTDVQHLELRSDSRQLNYQALGPDAFRGRYAQNLSGGDILRQDDLIPVSMESEVALAVQDPPPLNTGDRVDIFATFANAQQALVARGILI